MQSTVSVLRKVFFLLFTNSESNNIPVWIYYDSPMKATDIANLDNPDANVYSKIGDIMVL